MRAYAVITLVMLTGSMLAQTGGGGAGAGGATGSGSAAGAASGAAAAPGITGSSATGVPIGGPSVSPATTGNPAPIITQPNGANSGATFDTFGGNAGVQATTGTIGATNTLPPNPSAATGVLSTNTGPFGASGSVPNAAGVTANGTNAMGMTGGAIIVPQSRISPR